MSRTDDDNCILNSLASRFQRETSVYQKDYIFGRMIAHFSRIVTQEQRKRSNVFQSREELQSTVNRAVWSSLETYIPGKSNFYTHAVNFIKGYIKNEVRDTHQNIIQVPSGIKEYSSKVTRTLMPNDITLENVVKVCSTPKRPVTTDTAEKIIHHLQNPVMCATESEVTLTHVIETDRDIMDGSPLDIRFISSLIVDQNSDFHEFSAAVMQVVNDPSLDVGECARKLNIKPYDVMRLKQVCRPVGMSHG